MANQSRIKQITELLLSEPSDVFLNYALGLEYIVDSHNYLLAETQFKKVLQLDENYIAVYYQLGKLFEARAKNTEALTFYKTGLEKARQQKNNKAINEFGEAIFMLGD